MCIIYTHIQASIWLWIYLYTFKQARTRVSIYILKIPISTSRGWTKIDGPEGNRIAHAIIKHLEDGPNRILLSGWRTQNPKSAVLILELAFKILDIAIFAKVWILHEILDHANSGRRM